LIAKWARALAGLAQNPGKERRKDFTGSTAVHYINTFLHAWLQFTVKVMGKP